LTKKKTAKNKYNPAALGITDAQSNAYRIVRDRQGRGLTTTAGDVAEDWGDKNRSYVWKVLNALIKKKLLERYSQRYYKLKT
jgi:hypothetical protein